MRTLRLHHPARLLTVLLLMVAWLVATNHCAFGLMKSTVCGEAAHAHCHGGNSAPGKGAPANGMRECCKSIVGSTVPAKVEVKFDGAHFAHQLFVLLQVLATPPRDPALTVFVFDHGPPRVASFAESVLQRSLLGHAPPFAV